MAKQTPKPAPLGPLDYYAKIPPSKDGEFVHAQAQIADLSQAGSTEMRRTGDGVAAK
jgi:hypothetical protein